MCSAISNRLKLSKEFWSRWLMEHMLRNKIYKKMKTKKNPQWKEWEGSLVDKTVRQISRSCGTDEWVSTDGAECTEISHILLTPHHSLLNYKHSTPQWYICYNQGTYVDTCCYLKSMVHIRVYSWSCVFHVFWHMYDLHLPL